MIKHRKRISLAPSIGEVGGENVAAAAWRPRPLTERIASECALEWDEVSLKTPRRGQRYIDSNVLRQEIKIGTANMAIITENARFMKSMPLSPSNGLADISASMTNHTWAMIEDIEMSEAR